jgi:hypothetical protein
MWAWIWASGGSGRQRLERPQELYADLHKDLRALAEALGQGADTPDEVLRELRESMRRTDELFVAMAFHEETRAFYDRVIDPAARACQLVPKRVDREEPELYLTEAILSGIRRSVLVLADLTLARPNCHFEAGYALGAFRRVIFTCRDDHDVRSPTHDGQFRVHFDVDTVKITWWSLDSVDLEPLGQPLAGVAVARCGGATVELQRLRELVHDRVRRERWEAFAYRIEHDTALFAVRDGEGHGVTRTPGRIASQCGCSCPGPCP